MAVGHLMRHAENSLCSLGNTVVLRSSTFKQVAIEAQSSVGVADVKLIIAKLPSEAIRHVRFDRA